jgi:hypothetical protein
VLGRIFAMLVQGCLGLKLSASRCIDLCASGSATPFERGQGRPLREWVVVNAASGESWQALGAEALGAEALSFVGGRPSSGGQR